MVEKRNAHAHKKEHHLYVELEKKSDCKENYDKPYMSECKTNIDPKLKPRMLKH